MRILKIKWSLPLNEHLFPNKIMFAYEHEPTTPIEEEKF